MQVFVLLMFGVLITVVAGLLFSLPVYLLWNWLCPTIFHLPTITWLQAWGLLVLTGLLFKTTTSSSDKED